MQKLLRKAYQGEGRRRPARRPTQTAGGCPTLYPRPTLPPRRGSQCGPPTRQAMQRPYPQEGAGSTFRPRSAAMASRDIVGRDHAAAAPVGAALARASASASAMSSSRGSFVNAATRAAAVWWRRQHSAVRQPTVLTPATPAPPVQHTHGQGTSVTGAAAKAVQSAGQRKGKCSWNQHAWRQREWRGSRIGGELRVRAGVQSLHISS